MWIFHSRKLNNRINNIQERSLRIIYEDYTSTFEELLEKDKSVTIHIRNVQILAIEHYKVVNNIAPEILKGVFPLKENNVYELDNPFKTRNVKTEMNGIRSLGYLGPKIWNIVPKELRQIDTIEAFKIEIKKWNPKSCPCKLCKTYLYGVGYVKRNESFRVTFKRITLIIINK